MTHTTDTSIALRAQAHDEPNVVEVYDANFYENQVAASIEAARIYLKFLWQFLQPASVLDVGCGRGTWLKASHELGSKTLLGFDGDWNNQSLMIDSHINFQSIDLNRSFAVTEKVDLAISLEEACPVVPGSSISRVEEPPNARPGW